MLRVSEPDLTDLERRYVLRAFDSSIISGSGEFVARSESQLSVMTGAKHSLVTCNGTASLHLALMALGIGPGDEVIVPSFTYIASVNSILYVGANPVFVDVDETSWTLDPDELKLAVTTKTKAIMAVHLYGHPFDYELISKFAEDHGLKVIEDAAEAHFSTAYGVRVGKLGSIASFSFFGNKVLTCGEGGAVTTDSDELFSDMEIIRNQGMDPNRRFFHPIVGNNFRLNNLSASILSAQLERSDMLLKKRLQVTEIYDKLFAEYSVPVIKRPKAKWATLTPWLYSILLPSSVAPARAAIMADLLEAGIETRPCFTSAHSMPPYTKYRRASGLDRGVQLSAAGLNLPTSSLMGEDDVHKVVLHLRDCISRLSS